MIMFCARFDFQLCRSLVSSFILATAHRVRSFVSANGLMWFLGPSEMMFSVRCSYTQYLKHCRTLCAALGLCEMHLPLCEIYRVNIIENRIVVECAMDLLHYHSLMFFLVFSVYCCCFFSRSLSIHLIQSIRLVRLSLFASNRERWNEFFACDSSISHFSSVALPQRSIPHHSRRRSFWPANVVQIFLPFYDFASSGIWKIASVFFYWLFARLRL